MSRHSCIVLGAGGLVGQRLQQRLIHHPFFEMKAVAGNSNSAGKSLSEIIWRLEQERPDLPNLEVLDLNLESFIETVKSLDIKIAFSALPDEVAFIIETRLAESGIVVFSNSNAHRRKPAIPLVIPEINQSHLHLTGKRIFCATNCTLLPIAIPLSAISEKFDIKHIEMRSEQALSGAGWRLLFDQEALNGNHDKAVIGEAEKTSSELLHVFGQIAGNDIVSATFTTDFKCERVSRKDGHQVFVEVKTGTPVNKESILQKFTNMSEPDNYHLAPSSPINSIHLVDSIDTELHLWSDGETFTNQPLPSKDLKTGMAIVVGDVEIPDDYTIRYSAYSHNTIRGAAGGLILLAEFAFIESLI